MASYLPFSVSTPKLSALADEPNLEITVLPSATAYYAGDTFSARITFRNTRQSRNAQHVRDGGLHRLGQVGSAPNAEAGPSRARRSPSPLLSVSEESRPDSAGEGTSRGQRVNGGRPRSPLSPNGRASVSAPLRCMQRDSQTAPPPLPPRRGQDGIPKAHPHARQISIATTVTSPPPLSPRPLSPDLETVYEGPGPPPRLPRSPASSSAASRPSLSRSASSRSRPNSARLSPSPTTPRTPSYANAYGASLSPPPTHPSRHSREYGTTILWAHTRLTAHFHPSNTYIPPDPLLPLRSLMLHQPVGSGSLTPSSGIKSSPSRWSLSFGTGALGHSKQPSLTGSLFGLAKELVYGGDGGSLEEERRRVWNMKDLPVLETTRSLIGIDIRLAEGESRTYTYRMRLPEVLPPAHRGRAWRFSYDLVVSLNIASGGEQKCHEITIPIRPIVQAAETGSVVASTAQSVTDKLEEEDTEESLRDYARHLLDTLDRPGTPEDGRPAPRLTPRSPSHRSQPLDSPPTSPGRDRSASRDHFEISGIANGNDKGSAADVAVEEVGSRQAVEVLSQQSARASYDIAKNGEPVAVFTLTKTTFRLGESVLGVVTFNAPSSTRRVLSVSHDGGMTSNLQVSAHLESHELIPETLLPPSPTSSGKTKQPPLARPHATHNTAYTPQMSQMPIILDIPLDATPSFRLAAGAGALGGVEWRVRLAFLVSHSHKRVYHLTPTASDSDGRCWVAVESLAPLVLERGGKNGGEEWVETRTEVVECEIPIVVLPGSAGGVVKPSVHQL